MIKVESTTVTAGTMIVRKGRHPEFPIFNPMIRLLFGLFKPRSPITGYEFSGIIEEVGAVGKMLKTDRKKFLKSDGYFTSIAKLTEESLDGLKCMIDLVVEKKVHVFIDRTYDLADISAAHRYAETGHKRGNVVIKM